MKRRKFLKQLLSVVSGMAIGFFGTNVLRKIKPGKKKYLPWPADNPIFEVKALCVRGNLVMMMLDMKISSANITANDFVLISLDRSGGATIIVDDISLSPIEPMYHVMHGKFIGGDTNRQEFMDTMDNDDWCKLVSDGSILSFMYISTSSGKLEGIKAGSIEMPEKATPLSEYMHKHPMTPGECYPKKDS